MIIVSLVSRILLYAIPTLQPMREGVTLQAIPVTPLAVHRNSGTNGQSRLWNFVCDHHTGNRLASAGASEADDFDLIILPPAKQHEDSVIVRHSMGIGDFGPSRSVWSKDTWGSTEDIELQSCTYFTRPVNHVGYMRLGNPLPPDPSRVSSIPLRGEMGDILDLSWDEQSGRLVILVVFREGVNPEMERRRLLMVDLL
jgi:hypothetical protein